MITPVVIGGLFCGVHTKQFKDPITRSPDRGNIKMSYIALISQQGGKRNSFVGLIINLLISIRFLYNHPLTNLYYFDSINLN